MLHFSVSKSQASVIDSQSGWLSPKTHAGRGLNFEAVYIMKLHWTLVLY